MLGYEELSQVIVRCVNFVLRYDPVESVLLSASHTFGYIITDMKLYRMYIICRFVKVYLFAGIVEEKFNV